MIINRIKIDNFLKQISRSTGLDAKRYLRDNFWLSEKIFCQTVTSLILSILFARLATKDLLGNYQTIRSIFFTLSILALPGINTSILQSDIFNYNAINKKRIKYSLLAMPLLIIIGLFFTYYSNNSHVGIVLILSSLVFPFYFGLNSWESYLLGKEKFKKMTFYVCLQIIAVFFTTAVILIAIPQNIFALFLGNIISFSVFNVIFSYIIQKKQIKKENNVENKKCISYGIFLTKINTIPTIAQYIDRILINLMLNPTAVAIYYIATVIPEKLSTTQKTLLLTPTLRQIKKEDKFAPIETHFLKLLIISIILFTVSFLLIKPIVLFLYTDSYQEAILLGRIMLIGLIPNLFNVLLANVIIFDRDKKENLIFLAGNGLQKIIILFIFLKIWGLIGASAAFSVSSFITLTILLCLIIKRRLSSPAHL